MKPKRFKIDDRVKIEKPGSKSHGKTGRITKTANFETELVVQLDETRKYVSLKEYEMIPYIPPEDLQHLIDLSLTIKNKSLFDAWSDEFNQSR